MFDKYLSLKIKFVSFFSSIMVVFLHSFNLESNVGKDFLNFSYGYSFFIQKLISNGITRTAVPIFFTISGFLFFYNFQPNKIGFLLKFKKRSKNLLFPYLLWSSWGILFFFLIQLFPQSKPFFNNELILNYSLAKFFNTLFLKPINYQLWFIRDLIVLVILSPLVYLAIRYLKLIPVLFFLIAWIVENQFNFIILSNEAIFFFFLGAFFGIKNFNFLIHRRTSRYYLLFLILWILILIFKTMLDYKDYNNILLITFIHKVSIISGMISIWITYDILIAKNSFVEEHFYKIISFSFFIYTFHEPVLTIIKKSLFFVLGSSEFISLIVYFLAPVITIFISIYVGSFTKKITPKFYELITGGR